MKVAPGQDASDNLDSKASATQGKQGESASIHQSNATAPTAPPQFYL
jgi:hypothetical protein